MNPYTEHTIENDVVIRTFKESTDSEDFKWHRDLEDREIEALNNNNWQIQLEDELPKNVNPGETLTIPKGIWHRVIKGTGIAIYKIKKD
tara:strand:- start:2732 stop:2998 length:267 start_codon:yes stop_codon:yes gene_type:complete